MIMGAQALRRRAKEFGVGRALYRYYHLPIGVVEKSIREGGPLAQRRTELGRRDMLAAAADLPPLNMAPATGVPPEVHFLTGKKYWYQTLFCFYSLQINSRFRITPVLYDDGSLGPSYVDTFRAVVPWVRVVSQAELTERLEAALPSARFPTLRATRLRYPHLRKLTDLHAGRRGWTLVLDSDMLFFREPAELHGWMASPDRPCHMQDIAPAYGYGMPLLQSLTAYPLEHEVNVGMCAMRSEDIDWTYAEHCCRTLMEREGFSYFLEQALTAVLLAGQDRFVFSKRDYVVKPTLQEGLDPTAVMHHYVAESKRSHFQHGWRNVMKRLENGSGRR